MSWFWRFLMNRRKNDLRDELETHLQMDIANRIERGENPVSARQAAMREFGNVPLIQEVTRSSWGWLWFERLAQDLHYALRQIRRSPGFAITVIGTLALGIGAATAMFTVVDHVLLNPVPYRDPGRLVILSEGDGKSPSWYPPPWLDIEQWQEQSHSFSQIAYSTSAFDGRSYIQCASGELEIDASTISPNYFETLGVKPVLGRDFLQQAPSFAMSKNAGTIILSYSVWQQAFNGDRSILGRSVRINYDTFTVVGIMPHGFRTGMDRTNRAEVWLPFTQLNSQDAKRGLGMNRYAVIARLRDGVTLQAATSEMALIQQRVTALYPTAELRQSYSRIHLRKYIDFLFSEDIHKALLILLAASLLLWLIAGINAASLLLARSTARQREIAVRGALGATRTRVMQQMLVEGLLLGTIAALLGIMLAVFSIKLFARELVQHLLLPVPATPNASILTALLGLTLASVALAAFWPAWMASRAPIELSLRQGSLQGGAAHRQARARAALVSVEIALSLLLLVGCGLLLRTIYNLRQVPLGFRTDHILVAHLSIPGYRFKGQNMTANLYLPMLRRIEHLPGVDFSGLVNQVPLGSTYAVQLSMYLKGRTVLAWFKAATPGVQKVFDLPMSAGRYFNASDTANSQPVAVVNEAFAREYSPDQHNPAAIIGTELINLKKNVPTRVVGVLADVHQTGIAISSQPQVELCIPQISPNTSYYDAIDGFAMDLAIRTSLPTAKMIPALRTILKQANPAFANSTITTMDQIVADSYGSQQLAAHLLEIFGGAALLLSIVGLYGLMAYVVSQRTHELGIRVALGASRGNLLWLVLRQAAVMLTVGVICGTGLALLSGRIVRSFLFGIHANDTWTLASAALLLTLSGLAAAYLPARRAAHIDPMQALRAE
ncbi:MAG TPA: ABC transporter permease [Terracidiphilus sp.]|nr:ABC transporter permease [Terracidiphilus sp.]